ncbi:MAG: recombinase family protein [Bacillota bacterium]
MKVAAIYRVSTDKQVKRDGEETLPIQRAAVREFIAQQGWTLVQEYAEEGVSGFKVSADDRDVLQQAFRDAKAGRWQALIVFKADRLSRNAFEYPVVIDRFRKIGCEVWSVKDAAGGKLLALDTQMDKFVRFLEGWQAETESRNTSLRVSEAMQQLAKQGKWSGGPPPYGFRLNEARRPKSDAPALVIDQEQAQVIRLMVDLYLEQRMGCMLIAKELNSRAVPSPAGRPWDDQRVRRILQNPIIAGLPAFGRNRQTGSNYTKKNPYDLDQFVLPRDEAGNLKPVPEYQIIPLNRWLKLMAAMKTAKTTRKDEGEVQHTVTARLRSTDALLTGLVFCGHCGARLSADANTYTNKRANGTVASGRRLYYVCQTHLHKGKQFCDGQRTYGSKRLEQVVNSQLEMLLTMLDGQELAHMLLGGADKHLQEVEEQIRFTEAEQKKTQKVIEGWLARMDSFLSSPEDSPYTEEMLTAKIREAKEKMQALEATLARLHQERKQQPATPSQVQELADLAPYWWQYFQEATNEEKKILLRDLVERINVRKDGVEIVFAVSLEAFLPKVRYLAAARQSSAGANGGSTRQTERPSSPAASPSCSTPTPA